MKLKMTISQQQQFLEFLRMNDFEFYETFIAGLPLEAQEQFFKETPDFFSEYINKSPGEYDFESDLIYQNIIKKIHSIEKKCRPRK